MKANEAPENIYVHVRANKELGTTWHGKKITNSDIEYVRKDSFIEKTCAWLENNLQGIVGGSIYIEDFKEYLRGE